ncbi:hypothetical protein L1279_003549 [Planomicrobium sp. HSC-17F08]|nr:hypothetical protein [Planomicrobium sp. HSC-17F08]
MKRKVATPAGTARAEDPGLSSAKEAAEAVPAESVHLERNGLENGMFLDSLKALDKMSKAFSLWRKNIENTIQFVFIIYEKYALDNRLINNFKPN